VANPGIDSLDKAARSLMGVEGGMVGVARSAKNASGSINELAKLLGAAFLGASMKGFLDQNKVLDKLTGQGKSPFSRLFDERAAGLLRERLKVVTERVQKLNVSIGDLKRMAELKTEEGVPLVPGASEELKQKQRQMLNLMSEAASIKQAQGMLNSAKAAKTLFATLSEQVVVRWYSFNKQVQSLNASFDVRYRLYKQANEQEFELGHNIGDTAALYEVARKNGLLYGSTISDNLQDMVHLSLEAEDALGLAPDTIGEIYSAAKRIGVPFSDALNTITTMNQKLGVSAEEAAKLTDQVSMLSFEYNLGGQGILGATQELEKMGLSLKKLGINNPEAALSLVKKLAEPGSMAAIMSGGGPHILENREAMKASMEAIAAKTTPMLPSGPDPLGFRTQIAGSIIQGVTTLTIAEARIAQIIAAAQKAPEAVLSEQETLDQLRKDQLARTGQVWSRFFQQLHGVFTKSIEELTPAVDFLSRKITDLHLWFGKLPPRFKDIVIEGGKAVVTLLAVAGALESVALIGTVFRGLGKLVEGIMALKIFSWLGSLFIYLKSFDLGVILGGLMDTLGTFFSGLGEVVVTFLLDSLASIGPALAGIGTALLGGLVALLGTYFVYKLATFSGVGKIWGEWVGEKLWEMYESVVNLISKFTNSKIFKVFESLGNRFVKVIKDVFTEIIDWIISKIPDWMKPATKPPAKQQGTDFVVAQRQLAENFFDPNNATTLKGAQDFFNDQSKAEVGKSPTAIRALHNQEESLLKKNLDKLSSEWLAHPENEGLAEKMDLVAKELQILNSTAKTHLDTDKSTANEQSRNVQANQRKADERAFIYRYSVLSDQAADDYGWTRGVTF
jgi:hypothetical protein